MSTVIAVGIMVGRAEQFTQEIAGQKLTEAPAGFATPTLSANPGSQSVSNGIPEPPNDTFALDQANFEARDGNDKGLGPVYNATICVDCHQNPVTGGEQGKTFHVGGCPFIHGQVGLRTIPALEAEREGYTPCVRCMKKYLDATA